MKRSDIFTIIAVTLAGVIVSVAVVNLLLGDPNSKSVSYKDIEVIEASLSQPDPEVFNPDAINPTVEVYVGECIDRDQNGQLDEAELIACGRIDGSAELPKEEDETPEEEEEEAEEEEEEIEDETEDEDVQEEEENLEEEE